MSSELIKTGYRKLAVAVIKRAVIDGKYEWLDSKEADFSFELSQTEKRDYESLINCVKKRRERISQLNKNYYQKRKSGIDNKI